MDRPPRYGEVGAPPEAEGAPATPVETIARDLRVDAAARPGWVSAAERLPAPGEIVYCAEGAAELVRVVGKTGKGGKLLELKLCDGSRPPFFAAADNVRVPPSAG